MEDCVIYNSDEKEFVGWVNPLVVNDPAIIADSPSRKSDNAAGESQFFSVMHEQTGSWFRPVVLMQSGIDRLTLDYIIEFYMKVCKPLNISARSILCDEDSVWNQEYLNKNGVFAQNLVAKSLFNHVLNHNHDIPNAITFYTEFIRTHYDSEGEITSDTRLIFPYSFYMPFDTEEELLTAMLKSKSVTVTDGKIVHLKPRRPKGWQMREIHGSFTVLDISTQEEVTPPKSSSEFSGLYDPSSGIVYILFSPNDKAVLNALNELHSISRDMVITQENLGRYNNFLYQRSLEKLIYGIGIPGEITKLFWPGHTSARLSCDRISPLILFKILHHINYYHISEDKLDDWKRLLFTCHLVEPSDGSHPMYDLFKDGVSTRNHDRNCLMISKRSFADKSTLGAILNMQRERFATDIAFDAAAINQQIMRKEDTGQYHLARNGRPQQKISNIVFLTDNIISGGSTHKMLAFHFSGQATDAPSSSYYIKLDPGKTILEIIEANHPRIELHTVFWFSCLDECTVHPPTDGFYPVDYLVNETESIRFYVKAYQTYSPEQYLYTEEAFELAGSIYGKNSIPRHNGAQEHRRLVFRFNNMPGFSVFPKEVLSSKNKVGLFERRK